MAGRNPWIFSGDGALGASPIDEQIPRADDFRTFNPYSVQHVRPLAPASPIRSDIAQTPTFYGRHQPFFGNDLMVNGGQPAEAIPQAPRMEWSPSLAPVDIVKALTSNIGATDGAFQVASSKTVRNDQPSFAENAFLLNDEWPTQSAIAITPVGYRLPRPWPGTTGPWAAPTAPLGGWTELFTKSHQEGLRRLRSFRKTAREKAEKECWRRHDEERRECNDRYPDRVHNHHYLGCLDTALQRRQKCLENGYPNGPGELPKWGDEQEDVWFNTDR